MKKILLPMFVLILLAVSVIPVSAAGKGPGGSGGVQQKSPRGTFAITGTVSAIDAVNGTVTVQALRGNKLVQPYLNTLVTVNTIAKTRYLYKSSLTATATAITFADLEVGDPVSVNGLLANNIWTATRVTVGATLACLP
ncbi:MAG: hypothetical protein FJZ96_02945 [Chloroflexi bacterium]|nr:hypothetical protein [Chloroflexota bacterium]